MNRCSSFGAELSNPPNVPRERGDEPVFQECRASRTWNNVPRERGDEPALTGITLPDRLNTMFPASAGMNRNTCLHRAGTPCEMFPASAGMNREPCVKDRWPMKHVPRERGDEPAIGTKGLRQDRW